MFLYSLTLIFTSFSEIFPLVGVWNTMTDQSSIYVAVYVCGVVLNSKKSKIYVTEYSFYFNMSKRPDSLQVSHHPLQMYINFASFWSINVMITIQYKSMYNRWTTYMRKPCINSEPI